MMGVEASVLDRDDGVSDVLRHLRARERDPVLGRMQRGNERSVRRVQERRLRERPDVVVLQSRQAARGHPAGEAGERDTGGEGSPDLPHTEGSVPPNLNVPAEALGSIAAPWPMMPSRGCGAGPRRSLPRAGW